MRSRNAWNTFLDSWQLLDYKDFIQQFAIQNKTNQNSSQNLFIKDSFIAIPRYFLMYAAIKKTIIYCVRIFVTMIID